MVELSVAAQAAMYPQWVHILITILYGVFALVGILVCFAIIHAWREGEFFEKQSEYYREVEFARIGIAGVWVCLTLAFIIATPRHMLGMPSWWPISSSIPFVGAHVGTIERHRVLVAIDANQKEQADELRAECEQMKTALTAYAVSGVVDDALASTFPRPLVAFSPATVRRAEYVSSYVLQGKSEGYVAIPYNRLGSGGIAQIMLNNNGTMTQAMQEEDAVLLVQSGDKVTRIYLPGRAAIRRIVDECRSPFETLAQRNENEFYPPTHIAKIVPDLAYDMIGTAERISINGLSAVDRIMAEVENGHRVVNVQGYYPGESQEGALFVERLAFADAPNTVYRFPAAVALQVAQWTRKWHDAATASVMPDIPDDPESFAALKAQWGIR